MTEDKKFICDYCVWTENGASIRGHTFGATKELAEQAGQECIAKAKDELTPRMRSTIDVKERDA